jgi:hypothetical protein
VRTLSRSYSSVRTLNPETALLLRLTWMYILDPDVELMSDSECSHAFDQPCAQSRIDRETGETIGPDYENDLIGAFVGVVSRYCDDDKVLQEAHEC